MIPYTYFFRYATKRDKVLLWIGTVSLILAGAFLPIISLFYLELMAGFGPTETQQSTYDTLSWVAKCFVAIACGEFLAQYVYYSLWQHVAANLTFNLRLKYLEKFMT